MESWKTISKKTLITFGKFMRVEQHAIELPDGRIIDDWPWLVGPDFVNVLAITNDDLALIFRQGKYGLDGLSLAPVGGYIESGENPLNAAKRELLEETGYVAEDWIDLGRFTVDPNRGVGTGYLYLARKAISLQKSVQDDLEEQELVLMSLKDVSRGLYEGQFKAMAWATNIALALLYMNESKNKLC